MDTEARSPSDVLQVTARPVSTLPWSSLSTALNRTVVPAAMLEVGGDTVTVATAAWTTVTCAAPDKPSMVAVIVTGPPTVTPVTAPPGDTLATAALLLFHVADLPGNSSPCASNALATSVLVRPTATFAVAGSTRTDATERATTEMAALPSFPCADAFTVTGPPIFTPLTRPSALTETVVASLLCHVNVAESWLPEQENALAVSCADSPSATAAVVGVTSIRDTSVAAIGSQSPPPSSPPPHPASTSRPRAAARKVCTADRIAR